MHILLLLAALASADTLTGRVTDPSGQPVVLATVEIAELGRRVTTGADGAFRFTIPSGRYTLTVTRAGFAPASRTIAVRGTTTVDVQLAVSPFALEPVTLTATRQPIAPDLSPLPVATLSGDALRRQQGVSLAHVLEELPGLRTLSTGAQIGKPVIRGLAGSRVVVLENGSRLEDYSWSDEDGPSIETGFVRRVEVIRGPASVLYGTDAVGGVVNVISEPLPFASDRASSFMRTGFTLSGASNNLELGGAARAEGAHGSFGWRVAVTGRYGSNLHTPAGELDNTGFSALNGEGSAGWRSETGSLAVRVVHYGGEFKLLEANAAPGEQGGPERKLGDDRVVINADHLTGSWRLEAKAQYQRHGLTEISDSATTESEAFNLLLQTASLDLLAHHARGNALRGTLGISGLLQSNDASGRIPLVPEANLATGGAFAFEQLTTGKWSLLAGARTDTRRLHADRDTSLAVPDQTRHYNAWSADGGVVFHPAQPVALHVNVGRAWRAPTLFELFAHGPHIGEARYEQGDSTLRAETSRSVDVGLRIAASRMRAEISGYHNRLPSYIYITPTAQVIDSLPVYRYAQADAELIGAELSLEVELSRGLVGRMNFDAVRGTNLTAHEPLPLVPPRRGGLGIEWRDRIGVDVEGYARQDRPNPLDTPTRGYTLMHVTGGSEVRLLGRAMRLDVALRNALNTRYRSFLSRYKAFALDPGRNLIVRLSTGDVD
jgi:iron complex outermembrane recepter protein